MRSWRTLINTILPPILGMLLAAGCATGGSRKEKKEYSTLRLHMETHPGALGSGKVRVLRSDPITIPIEKDPFLDEGFIRAARVMETPGGHAIGVEFTERGSLRLQMATSTRPGRRMVIWSRWTEGRWLAAPIVVRGNDSGVLIFAPDATREECERIVHGLNNIAVRLGNQPKPPKESASATRRSERDKKEQEARVQRRDAFDPLTPDGIWEP